MVDHFTELKIKFKQVSFRNGLELQKDFLFERNAIKKDSVLGDFSPLESPDIRKFNIILGFDTLFDKWYLIKNSQNANEEEQAYVWVFKFDELVQQNLESKPVELKEKLVINSGDCNLEVMKNE